MTRHHARLIAVSAVFALLTAACGGDDEPGAPATTQADVTTTAPATTQADVTTTAPATTQADVTTTAPAMGEDTMMLPGEGVTINMARADWATGYFQAAVYRQVLQELGYEVTDPADLELGPSLAYLAMADGDVDFWVNSWYPGHLSWWEPELPDGSVVGDHLVVPGPVFAAGGLQGFLITKDFADEYGVYTMDDLNRNADALAAYDAADPVPGNGKADIYGCQESWTCDNIIISQIAFAGWENIEQVIAGYDAMFAEATAKANRGEPMIIYTWTPSAYITELIPGVNVYWLGMEAVLDDSNPANQDGGDKHDQRPGIVAIGTDHCPAASDAGCQLGWIPADITVTANRDFMTANPVAARLLTVMNLPIVDVSIAQVEQAAGRDSEEAINEMAAEWIANNRDSVDGWIAEAKAAA